MKALLWCLVAVGLLPCLLLALAGLSYWQQLRRAQAWSRDVVVHDEHFRLGSGPWSCELYPRPWAFALLALGIVAIVVSLVALLHVPKDPGGV